MTRCHLACGGGLAEKPTDSALADLHRHGRLLALEIELGGTCNLRCPHCRRDSGTSVRKEELSWKEWLEAIDQGLDLGVRQIILGGQGEPLGNDLALPLMRAIRERGCDVELMTNGSLISPPLARELFELGAHVVTKRDSQE